MKICLLLGFDTEAPFDQPYQEKDVAKAVDLTLEIVAKLNSLLDSYGVSRTFFLLGLFLAASLKQYDEATLREILECGNPLVDLQSHGYSHRQYRAIAIDPDRISLSPAEVFEDVAAASDLMQAVLKKTPIGLRTPRGYALGLNGEDEVIENIKKSEVEYVSSDLRDRNWQICTALFDQGELRQPRQYANGLWELPAHGWQDTAFSGLHLKGVPDFAAMGKKNLDDFIFLHYRSLINQACATADKLEQPIYLGTCLHPQAVQVYDPDLKLLEKILDYACLREVEVCSYTAAYRQLVSSRT